MVDHVVAVQKQREIRGVQTPFSMRVRIACAARDASDRGSSVTPFSAALA